MEAVSLLDPRRGPRLSSLRVLTVDLMETPFFSFRETQSHRGSADGFSRDSPGLQRCPLMCLSAVSLCFIFVRYRRTVPLLREFDPPALELDQPAPSGRRRAPRRAPDPSSPPTWSEEARRELKLQSRAPAEQSGRKGCGDS